MNADAGPRSIDLAEEAPFVLAGAEVRPATLEVVAAGRREMLEPRVMQVLVALARRRGEMVSRDDLIAQCWGGRIVGEDAITRALAQLRKLARSVGGFEIETVPRVGVRLVERGSDAGSGRPAVRRWAVFAVVAVLLAFGGLAVWISSRTLTLSPAEPRIAVSPFRPLSNDPVSLAFAADLSEQVASLLAQTTSGLAVRSGAPEDGSADLLLGGTIAREGDLWRVRAHLADRRSRLTLWATQYERRMGETALLSDAVAAGLTDMAHVVLETTKQPGLKLDPRTLGLYVAAADAMTTPRNEAYPRPLRLFEQVVEREPQFASARATLALNLVNASRNAPPAERAKLQRRARAEAARAIRTYPPTGGLAHDSLYVLSRLNAPTDLVAAEELVLKGMAMAPENAFLSMRECRFLVEVGRARDAIPYCERATTLRPLSPPVDYTYAYALLAAGDTPRAEEQIERALRFHPGHLQTLRLEFEMAAFGRDHDSALRLLESRRQPPVSWRPEVVEALALFLHARKSGKPADGDRAMAALWKAARGSDMDFRHLVFAAAQLGRPDDAFRALDEFGVVAPPMSVGIGPAVLMDPSAAPLRRDPRFWRAAAKGGYLNHWLARDRWPDFCREPDLPFDCRKQAERAGQAARMTG
jgi:DNA-binding winged helix-turn-helix (wHTH) protein/TolB-like protein